MANTFTAVTSNLGTKQVPLPYVTNMTSGGVTPLLTTTPGQAYVPIKPLPNLPNSTYGNAV